MQSSSQVALAASVNSVKINGVNGVERGPQGHDQVSNHDNLGSDDLDCSNYFRFFDLWKCESFETMASLF